MTRPMPACPLRPRFQSASRRAFWLSFAAVLVLTQVPSNTLPAVLFDWWDKAQHALAFATLFLLGRLGYPPEKTFRLLAGLALFGAVIEVLQALTGWRTGDVEDWVADVAGLAIGWTLGQCALLWHRFAIDKPPGLR